MTYLSSGPLWVNNSGMPLWEALIPLALVLALIIFAAIGTGVALAHILRPPRRREPWSPFDADGNLRPDLFKPVDEGGDGFVMMGAIRDE